MIETHTIPPASVRWTLILGLVWFLWYALILAHPISKEQASALVAREVPLGTHRTEIEARVQSKGWGDRYGYQVRDEWTVSSWFKGPPEEMKGYIGCLIEDNTRIYMGNGDLLLVFYLDKGDKLIQFPCHQYLNSM